MGTCAKDSNNIRKEYEDRYCLVATVPTSVDRTPVTQIVDESLS
ncbi:hypothetical protein M2118_000562 [Aurantimicrobium minutum]|nr:hypothetical protein [Aurantimicrobium minutum]